MFRSCAHRNYRFAFHPPAMCITRRLKVKTRMSHKHWHTHAICYLTVDKCVVSSLSVCVIYGYSSSEANKAITACWTILTKPHMSTNVRGALWFMPRLCPHENTIKHRLLTGACPEGTRCGSVVVTKPNEPDDLECRICKHECADLSQMFAHIRAHF